MLDAINIRTAHEDELYERLGDVKAEQTIQDRKRLSAFRTKLVLNNRDWIFRNNQHIEKKIRDFGCARLARALEVTNVSVNRWITDGVPVDRVPMLSILLGCSYHALRPDVFPRGI